MEEASRPLEDQEQTPNRHGDMSNNTDQDKKGRSMKYGIDETPPLHICVLFGVQLTVTTMGGPLVCIYLIRSLICGEDDNLLFAELLSTAFCMAGLCTLLQVTFGVRLPAIEGSSGAFLASVAAIMTTDEWKCPSGCNQIMNSTTLNWTSSTPYSTSEGSPGCGDKEWRPRLLALSGGLIAASVVHCVLGLTGAVGFLLNYIGPLTIAPTVSLISLSVAPMLIKPCSYQWGIAILMTALYLLFSLVLSRFEVPVPTWTRHRGFYSTRIPVFQLFPLLLTLATGWLTCLVLTLTGVFPDDPTEPSFHARTDGRMDVIGTSKWFFFPYPGYWGAPTFSAGVFVAMMAAVVQSTAESVGDYYATASICGVPTPPKHAVNRGVAVEGFGSLLSGLFGACHANTTYSSVVAIISSTKVSSRLVFQLTGVIYIICGVFGKFGAAMSMCPDPVISGTTVVLLGLMMSAGLSMLRHCDMTSSRNMSVLGTSLMLGVMLPRYFLDNPGSIRTGSIIADQIFTVFLSSGMLIGGVIAFVLDNSIPGTLKERGMVTYLRDLKREGLDTTDRADQNVYDLPWGISRRIQQCGQLVTYLPFLPQYDSTCTCLKTSDREGAPASGKNKDEDAAHSLTSEV